MLSQDEEVDEKSKKMRELFFSLSLFFAIFENEFRSGGGREERRVRNFSFLDTFFVFKRKGGKQNKKSERIFLINHFPLLCFVKFSFFHEFQEERTRKKKKRKKGNSSLFHYFSRKRKGRQKKTSEDKRNPQKEEERIIKKEEKKQEPRIIKEKRERN